jgi:iron complex outermembrane receptor protein
MRGNNALLCLLASAIGFFSTQSVYSLPADALSPNAASTAPSASVSPSDDNSLQEIVVTATRREAALQDVPITVSAFTGAVLQNYHIQSSTDLMELVPNLTISSQVGAMVVYIRGVGQLATNAGQEPAVATYIDGVYQPTVFAAVTTLSDIERVEVVKGPQGTLFGRNATGGLINIATLDPSFTPSGNALVSYGNYDTIKLTGYGTTGITDAIAADLSIYYYDQMDGVGENLVSGTRLTGTGTLDIRSKVLIQPTSTTKIIVAADYNDNHTSVGNNLALLPGSIAFNGQTAPANFYNVTNNTGPTDENSNEQISVHVNQELSFANLVSITAYIYGQDREYEDADATTAPLINAELTQHTSTATQELQLASKKGDPLTWIVGAFYYYSDAAGAPTGTTISGLAFGGGLGAESARPILNTRSEAVYGEATYEILPRTDLTLGARYTRDKKTLTGATTVYSPTGAIISTTQYTNGPNGSIPDSETWSQPTYRAILDYHFTDAIMGYVQYSRGFKSGGFDTGFPSGIPYKPETLDDYEGGFKTEFLDRRLRFNIAGFYYNYKDLQLPILIDEGGVPSQVTENATSAKEYGVDVDSAAQITRNFNIDVGFGYLSSTFKDFPDAPCTYRSLDGGVTPSPTGMTYGDTCNVSGLTTTHAPKITYNIGGNYAVPTAIGEFGMTLNYSYMTKFYYTVDDRLTQPGYGLLNGQIRWTPLNSRYTIDMYGQNLTGKKYTIAQYAQSGISEFYVAGLPLMYGIEFRAKF